MARPKGTPNPPNHRAGRPKGTTSPKKVNPPRISVEAMDVYRAHAQQHSQTIGKSIEDAALRLAIPKTGERQTGRTTLQMRSAPHGAIYVWCNDMMQYPERLAQDLGRSDLKIYSPQRFQSELFSMQITPHDEYVIDHATHKLLTAHIRRELEGLEIAKRLRIKTTP